MLELSEEFWKFVEKNLNSDPSALRLKYHGKADIGFDVGFAIVQIECRRKFSKKFSETLAAFSRFVFPSVLAGEQATSDRFARFHASLLNQSGHRLSVADLTSGLGIDVFHLARYAGQVVAVELDSERAESLRYNASGLEARYVTVVEGDCRKFIEESTERFDVIFIDPARRAVDGSRLFALSDCQPDLTTMMPRLLAMTEKVIVKMSPMLDISQVFRELPMSSRIIALGTTTECRELVAVVEKTAGHDGTGVSGKKIEAVTLTDDGEKRFVIDCGGDAYSSGIVNSVFGVPVEGDILCEPYPAVMKVGGWQIFADRYGLKMLSANSHIFFVDNSETDIAEIADQIPAALLRIEAVLPYQSKVIKRFKKEYPKISITCRNFDIDPVMLRKKLGVADGGDLRLFATKDSAGEPILIVARPIPHARN